MIPGSSPDVLYIEHRKINLRVKTYQNDAWQHGVARFLPNTRCKANETLGFMVW
jgi:hypothetical protein